MNNSSLLHPSKNTFVLIHGAWHGAWCWNKIVPLLESKGHRVIAPDLLGRGNDNSPTAAVTLSGWVNKIVDIAHEQEGTIILLGHSSGGTVIAQAAEVLGPKKVAKLIFLDAFMPLNGESVFSLVEKFPTGSTGKKNLSLAESMIFSADQKTCTLDPVRVHQLLYHDCTDEDVAFAKAMLGAQPLAALATPVEVTEKNYGAIPKYFILCTDARDFDKTDIALNTPCRKIYRLKSSHSPFFSMPDELADVLHEISEDSDSITSILT